jgi:amidase
VTDLLSAPGPSLADTDASAMLAALEAREISAVELLDQHIALIEARNPGLNAIIDIDVESARRTSAELDRRRSAGERLGPLAGIPFTVKSSFDVRGLRTSQGRLADSRIARSDAPAVARLRDAGAVLLGKTNLPLFLADLQSFNEDFGRTDNPWDAQRTPGGSSGGSAAAVAAGLSAGDLGSDLAGSIRVPAAWCGVYGHRPSNGTISKQGHMPWPDGGLLEPPLSASGPLARSAADLGLFTGVLMGPAPQDATGWRLELPPARMQRLAGVRVALWLDDPCAPIDSEVRSALERLALALEDAGCVVAPLEAVPIAGTAAVELFERLQAVELAHSDDPGAAEAEGVREAWRDGQWHRRITAGWTEIFETVDVVLAPTVPTVAPHHSAVPPGERTMIVDGQRVPASVAGAWSRLANLGRGPSTVVPLGAGRGTGMPVGAQLIGPYLEDLTPLRFAELAEREGLLVRRTPPGW